MSITKSFNKHNNTYYAYETSYIWDEKLQRKTQKKVCIGKYDSVSGEIIPNAKRGRPARKDVETSSVANNMNGDARESFRNSEQILQEINNLVKEINCICSSMDSLTEKLLTLEEKICSSQKQVAGSNR